MPRTPKKKPGRRQVHESALAYDFVDPRSRVERLVAILGNKRVAEILHVSPSQPSRWRRGIDRVSAENVSVLIELDYVVSRMLGVWVPEVARLWLEGSEPFLNGARPIDVMILRGPRAVISALDGIESGAYA